MDARSFLELVVPWELGGYVTVHWYRPGKIKFTGRSCRSIEEVLQTVADIRATAEADIYFCLSRQRLNSGHRSRASAIAIQSAWADIDVDPDDPEKYSTVGEAIASLLSICDQLGIPRPSAIIASGGGIHAYWFSDRPFSVEEWQPYADALKAAFKNAGLKFDAAVTGDAARVLRLPYTHNWKEDQPRPVKLLQTYCNGTRFDFSQAFAKIADSKPTKSTKTKSTVDYGLKLSDAFKHLKVKNLAEGLERQELPPIPLGPILPECGWMREAIETGGKAFKNPAWNLTTLCATFMENGNDLAHRFGDQHPDYDFGRTEEEWARKSRERRDKNLGFPSCGAIQAAGSTHCAGCKYLELGKSPLNIGLVATKAPDPDEAETLQEIKELGGRSAPDLQLPPGYVVNEKGLICAHISAAVVSKKIRPARLVQMFKTVVKEPSLQFQRGHFGLGFTFSSDKGSYDEAFVPSSSIYAPSVFTSLSDQFVLYESEKEAMTQMGHFAPSWLDKLRADQKAVRDAGTFGWRWEDSKRMGFVYNSVLYHESGRAVPLINTTEDEFRSWYTPMGSTEPWLKACSLLTDRKRPELDVLISIGFAAPLMTFQGSLYGGIVSVWGEPGTSKSSAQQVAAAVWGHPKQTRESLNSTPKSVQGRLGRTRNLAAFWDDVQDERHQENLFNTLFVATEGAEGGRLNPDSTMKQRLEWQTLLAACSNISFVEFLSNKQKSTTAGMRRVFEYKFDRHADEPGMINMLEANNAFAALEHNYGMIGIEYAKILAKEHNEINKLVADITNSFTARVQGTVDENYWWGMCGVLLAGATLARRLGADISLPAMEDFLAEAYAANRVIRKKEGTEGGTTANTESGLTGFLNRYLNSGNVVITDRMFRTKSDPVNIVRHAFGGKSIYIHIARDERKIVISRRAFRDYLREINMDPRQVGEGLFKFYRAIEAKRTLGGGTAQAQTQEHCYEIIVAPGDVVLETALSAFGEPKTSA